MKAIILAAGRSSRTYPLTNNLHKSMISLMGQPLLAYTIFGLKKSGIKEIVLVIDEKSSVKTYFGNGEQFGVSINYVIQPKPLGMGNAVLLTKKYIEGDFLLLNAYHLDADKFIEDLLAAKTKGVDAVLLAKKRKDATNFGVLRIDKNRVAEVVEKPAFGKEPSKLCIVGIYLLAKDFFETLAATQPEHYQLEKALSVYAINHWVKFIEIEQEAVAFKFPWDLLSLKNYLLQNIQGSIGKNVTIAKSAEIIGKVTIEDGVKIMEKTVIKGPCYIGKNVFVGNNAVLRNGVDLEENAVVGAYLEIKNSILMANATTHSGFIGDSIIGAGVKIGAQFSTGNVRLDRDTVKVVVKGEKVDSGLKNLGVIVGENTRIGIKCSTMPGIIIGKNAIIGPATTVLNNVLDNTKYYTKFQELVVKNDQ